MGQMRSMASGLASHSPCVAQLPHDASVSLHECVQVPHERGQISAMYLAFSPEHSPSRAQLAQSVRLSLQMPESTASGAAKYASRRRAECCRGGTIAQKTRAQKRCVCRARYSMAQRGKICEQEARSQRQQERRSGATQQPCAESQGITIVTQRRGCQSARPPL